MFNKKMQLAHPAFPAYFLLGSLAFLIYLLYLLYAPFITILIFAAFFATIFYPLYRRISKLFRGMNRLSSLVTCILTFLVILIPLSLFATMLISEGISAFYDIASKIQGGFFEKYFQWFQWEPGNFLYDQYQKIIPFINLDNIKMDLFGKIGETAQAWATSLGKFFFQFIENFFTFVLSLIIFFFALYYFFKDGNKIVEKIMDLSPLPVKYEKAVFSKFKEVSLAMLFGIFFTAVIQGTLAGIGYAVVGIPNPIFWATATGVFSLVPLIGTAAIWIPASIILVAMGNLFGGIGLFLWGMLVVSTVDNFVRPFLIEGRAPVHPLMTFLAVLGGVFAFGLKGIIFGPLVLNLLIAFMHIYEMEYAKVLKH
ncbi:AI-2E family transporter [Candidatus Peregrinibacteria bacterium]|nr:AI-2E family transporter [Candidatus Peregrinibacteria bacterium]